MKKFKITSVAAFAGILLLAVVFSSCQSGKNKIIKETKREYVQRVFLEQTEKQQYYTAMFLKAVEKLDIKTMQSYRDSSAMACYCSHNAYVEMQRLNNR